MKLQQFTGQLSTDSNCDKYNEFWHFFTAVLHYSSHGINIHDSLIISTV